MMRMLRLDFEKLDFQKIFTPLVVTPFVLMALLGLVIASVRVKSPLKPREKEILRSSLQKPAVTEKKPMLVAALHSPTTPAPSQQQGFPTAPLLKMAPTKGSPAISPPQADSRVSFILINEHSRLAIIDGKVVREGDTVNRGKVSRIQRDKVLLTGKEGEKWLGIH